MIDWHNYGYSILELSLTSRHPLVRFAKWLVYSFAKYYTVESRKFKILRTRDFLLNYQ